ncbi:MAG: queuosine salvage family protein [Chloroflexota bacterium]|nr:queuosine salvage family protein [Dehalococcoidia bacterium]MDW8252696.1 queuosine salvage family protein [Chloroflexota bacterium]
MTLGVRETTARVVARARQVRLVPEAAQALAAAIQSLHPTPPAWNARYHLVAPPATLAQYLLLVDALNFSFWGEPKWSIEDDGERLDGYWALAAALKRAIRDGVPLLDARFLADLDRATLAAVLRGNCEIPMLEERLANAREVGRVLVDRFEGTFAAAIAMADGSAEALVRLLVDSFPSFNDCATYDGDEVRFYKRAQLLASDLAAAGAVPPWRDRAALTVFADYQLPRVLRAFGVLEYAPPLAETVDARREIPAGAPEEVEIRAATVQAGELIREALAARGRAVTAVEVDTLLWTMAQAPLPNDRPYHRTRTIFY